MSRRGEMCMLTGDCGGTNTRLSLWTIDPEEMNLKTDTKILFAKKYFNEKHSSFVDICQLFLQESGLENPKISVCVLACAGPIWNQTVTFTNVSSGWSICGSELEQTLEINQVELINDFAAMGYGLLTLKSSEYLVLHEAERDEVNGPVATIGAGTGLGECYLTPNHDTKKSYTCYACEGGHADFAPANELEIELWTYLKTKFGERYRISVERVISGIGLSNIYEFLAMKYPERVNSEIHDRWAEAGAMAGAVISAEAEAGDGLCDQAMMIFLRAYGREAGNAALKYFPTGGLYLTGGLAPKNLKYFTTTSSFLEAFFDKGRVSAALNHIPVYLVLTEDLGERGAQYFAMTLLCVSSDHDDPKLILKTTTNDDDEDKLMKKRWTRWSLETRSLLGALVLVAGFVGSTLTRKYHRS